MSNESRYEVNKPDVVAESVDGEALIVHLGTGAYYSARGSADIAWQMIASGASAEATAAALGDGAASPEAQAAVERFIQKLMEEGLLRARTTPPREAPVFSAPAAYADPELEKFTDMQDLLLLDPIHDVEEDGWPNAKPVAGV